MSWGNGEQHQLGTGDAILFDADVPHAYRDATARTTTPYLVMTYANKAG